MRIGIIGVGHIGKTVTRQLSAIGHDVKVANSRGPETIEAEVLSTGARAVFVAEAVVDCDVVVLSIPFNRILEVAPLVRDLPSNTLVVDTSNYYPLRDAKIEAIENGQVESMWVAEQLGRPVVKAWNAIDSDSFAKLGRGAGDPGRVAIPVAADSDSDRQVGMELVEATRFDAFDAGTLAESWRQQPGTPAYCTNLTREELPGALAAADRARSPRRRDLVLAVVQERYADIATTNADESFLVRLNRLVYM